MQAVRQLLPQGLWKVMEKELGREEALRLLWPAVVGRPLAAQTRLQRIVNDGRGGTLVVSVADGEWRRPIASLGKMILDAVHSFWGRPVAERIEFVVGPPLLPPSPAGLKPAARPVWSAPAAALPAIADNAESLEEVFARSARKYFARQEEAAK